MTDIKIANTAEDYQTIETLAHTIWHEHYTPIIGKAQVDYMLNKFQNAKAVREQVAHGFEYFTVFYDAFPVGYISIKREESQLFLSKIYVLSSYRGKGLGKTAMAFIEEKAKAYQLHHIRLTVNKYNTNAIKAYEKLGFENIGVLVQDIGNGFVMDDYELVKTL